jgi:V/A-type H+/Na+-transporting ATPase subunit K
MTPTSRTARTFAVLSRSLVALLVIVASLATWLALAARPAAAAGEAPAAAARLDPQFAGWALVAAALSTALAALGAGYAVGRVGSAAVGAIAEKPELFGRVLVLVGLAEGIAIYGLIVSILILNRIG